MHSILLVCYKQTRIVHLVQLQRFEQIKKNLIDTRDEKCNMYELYDHLYFCSHFCNGNGSLNNLYNKIKPAYLIVKFVMTNTLQGTNIHK